jgi:Flp pilus assembly protein TadB
MSPIKKEAIMIKKLEKIAMFVALMSFILMLYLYLTTQSLNVWLLTITWMLTTPVLYKNMKKAENEKNTL